MLRVARSALYLGIIATVVLLSVFHARLIAEPVYSYTGTFRFGWSIVYIVVLAVTAYGFGLPDLPRTPRQALLTSVGAALTASVAISIVQLVAGDALLPRFVVFGTALVVVPWYLLCAGMSGSRGVSSVHERALVVGDGVDARAIRDEADRSPERPVVIAEVVPLRALVEGGAADALLDRARRERATLVVLDRDAQAVPGIVSQAATLHEAGVRVRTLSLFYDEWLGMLPMSELERVSLMFDIGEIHRVEYTRIKRVLDVVLALFGMLALGLAVPIVFLGDLIANRGPLFYRQDRVGKGGEVFRILKFRTMRDDAAAPTEWTSESDPRITPFGRVLRVSHLDELPQMINILRGDLSMVGPRPEQPRYVVELVDKLPFYDMRHLVRPGLTGWAQVKYGYAGDESDALEKLQYDFYYLRHQSLGLDLRIIGRTIRSVLGREGR